jgi:hypothetical protein
VDFRYAAVALPDLAADEYLETSNPLGPALASLMRPSRRGRPRQKLDSLLRVARSPVDDARKSLLAHVVESYVRLNRREADEYERLYDELPAVEAKEMVTVFEQRGIERGLAAGMVAAKRADIVKVLRARFSAVYPDVEDRLNTVEDLGELDLLFDRALTAATIEEAGLPQRKAQGA